MHGFLYEITLQFTSARRDTDDTQFSRSFDWYHGHSWAKGLFDSGDGKDEESSSEDAFASYAIKMWGKVIGDANMEARGNLQLAIQARSFQNYFLMASDNTVQPARFIPNKVTGIVSIPVLRTLRVCVDEGPVIREQSRPYDVFRQPDGICRRHTHDPHESYVRIHAVRTVRVRGVENLLRTERYPVCWRGLAWYSHG